MLSFLRLAEYTLHQDTGSQAEERQKARGMCEDQPVVPKSSLCYHLCCPLPIYGLALKPAQKNLLPSAAFEKKKILIREE